MIQPLWKKVWCSLKKIKNRIAIWCSNPTSEYILGFGSQSDIFTLMFRAELSRIGRQCKCPSMNKWILKNVIYTYSGILFSLIRKEILLHASNCMHLEVIMLNEINQSQKDNAWFLLYEVAKVVKFKERKSKMVVTKDWIMGEIGIVV